MKHILSEIEFGKMDHKMLHNALSLDLSSIILFWKKSRKTDHVNWIDMKLNIHLKDIKCSKTFIICSKHTWYVFLKVKNVLFVL